MCAGFYSIVLRRQSESVKSYREENVVTLHSALAADNLHAGVSLDVSDMHSCSAGIRELDKPVELREREIVNSVERALLLPAILPFLFNCLKIIVCHLCHSFRG